MGSPVSAVMEDIETRALNTFISGPKLWKRYVDDTLLLLKQEKLTDFFNHINAVENSINFTMEKERIGSTAFLDTLITYRNVASLVQRYIGNQHTLVNTCISLRASSCT